MKISHSLKANFAILTLCLVSSIIFTSCGGGGGGGGDGTPETTRPKTMDGLNIRLPGGVSFTFSRSVGTAAALTSGQLETGSFVYTLGGTNLKQYPNLNGDTSDISFPDSITGRVYTYLAVNENSGILTLNGVSVDDLNRTGGFNAANGSFAYYFHSDSATSSIIAPATHPTVQMDVTFNNNGGSTVSISSVVLSILGSAFPGFDTTYPASPTINLGGSPVPFNYNPVIDPLRPSRIVPESLDGLVFLFTNGVPNPVDDFSVQFVSDAAAPNQDIDEMGHGLERVAGAVVNVGVQYTWTRTGGTDNAALILSAGSNTFDGSYELQFTSENTGVYIGTVDAGTPLASQVSGTFITRSN